MAFIAVSDDVIVNFDQVKCVTQVANSLTIEYCDGTCTEVRGASLVRLLKPLGITAELNGEVVFG